MHKFKYDWSLKDAIFTKDKGKVFSCFACGGGSTMGYKLAGFDVIGCNEIDKRMMFAYCKNHNPRFPFLEPIQEFKNREDLPPELYNLDILDGSPPCSTFSIAGSREDAWGVKKHFREGQAAQVLDTLFFDFIDLAKKLQPKVVIAENVKGLLLGNAKKYAARIYQEFDKAGYVVQHFLLDAQKMGVPQRRERVFFVCLRKDLLPVVECRYNLFDAVPVLDMEFAEPTILLKEIQDFKGKELVNVTRDKWEHRQPGDRDFGNINERMIGKEIDFNLYFVFPDEVCGMLTARERSLIHWEQPRFLSQTEICKISTFPSDYEFAGQKPYYICGMSVPPVMMAQIATRVFEQWLSKIK